MQLYPKNLARRRKIPWTVICTSPLWLFFLVYIGLSHFNYFSDDIKYYFEIDLPKRRSEAASAELRKILATYYKPNPVTITFPLSKDRDAIYMKPSFTLTGTAALTVDSIALSSTCGGEATIKPVTAMSGADPTYLHWSYEVNVDNDMLCGKGGSIDLTAVPYVRGAPTVLRKAYGMYTDNTLRVNIPRASVSIPPLISAHLLKVGREKNPLQITFPDMKAIRLQDRFSITGRAGSGVTSIYVHASCNDETHKLTKYSPASGQWFYNVDVELGNLCRGNTYTVNAYDSADADPDHLLFTEHVNIESRHGLWDKDHFTMMQTVKKLMTNTHESVKNDSSIAFTLPSDLSCEILEKNQQRPYFAAPITPIGFDLAVAVRTMQPEDKELLSKKSVWITEVSDEELRDTYIIAFYEKDGDGYVAKTDVPIIIHGGCGWWFGMFTVYHPQPGRIFINSVVGHESGPVSYLFDGENWHQNYDLLDALIHDQTFANRAFWTPLSLNVGKDFFSLTETSYCCDVVEPKYPNKWSEFIFDVMTFELVDVVLHERPDKRVSS